MDRFIASRPVRIGIAVFSIAVFALYVDAVYRVWRADWQQDQRDRGSLEASAHLQPWDADTQWLLGQYFLNGAQDYENALAHLNRAVELDPYDGRYWLDLAVAHEVRGDTAESQDALRRALRAEPTSTQIAWQAANFYLAQNDSHHALPLFRVVLQHDASNTILPLDLSWRATRSVSQMVSEALPAQPAFYFAFLKILMADKQSSPANELWHHLNEQRFKFSVEEAFPYFDYLIQTQQVDQAKQVWTDLSRIDPEVQDGSRSNLVHNGGFEGRFLNGGFDWRIDQTGDVNVALDAVEYHRGARALRFAFTGTGVSDTGVYEYVPVQPNTPYRFSAFVKTQEITTASGPRLAVEDTSTRATLATTDEFLETSGWEEHGTGFITGSDTHLVTLRIVRTPGAPLIKGTLWLDDVVLAPGSARQRATP
jgi:tetratricopeptide (TPR) repeat protein